TTSLGKFFVPTSASGQVEFLGVLFNAAIVTEAVCSPGTSPLFFFHGGHVSSGQADISKGGSEDMAAVDDFVYAEPATHVNPLEIQATEGAKVTAQAAHFTSTTAGATAGNFTASINWGDGSAASTGVVSSAG